MAFSWSPKYSFTASIMMPSLLPYYVPGRLDFSFGERAISREYGEGGGGGGGGGAEEGFQIHIQSQQSWQRVTTPQE